jgi:hypothetical protein
METWTKGGICWPRDLLPKEVEFSNVRILSFGYESRIIDSSGHASLTSLLDNLISLLKGLYRERRQDAVSSVSFPIDPKLIYSAGPPVNLCCALTRRTRSETGASLKSTALSLNLTVNLAGTQLFGQLSDNKTRSCLYLTGYARHNLPWHSSSRQWCRFACQVGCTCCTGGV